MSETISANRPVITRTGNYAAAQTDTVIWTPATGMRICLLGLTLSSDGTNVVRLETGATDVVPPMYLQANVPLPIPSNGAGPIWIGAANGTLTVTSTGAVNLSVLAWGYETQANG